MSEHMICQVAGCTAQESAFAYNNPHGELEWLCDEHAKESGYCLGCHLFGAGIESFDFSELPGYCYECIQELKDETGEFDDTDDEYDYEYDEDY